MGALVWRLTFGWLVAGALRLTLRLAWRHGPALAVGAVALVLWPSVAVAWGLRRWGLPAVGARWPRGARWCGPGLGLAGGLLAAAYALSGESWRRAAGDALRRRLARAADGAARREPVAGGPGAGRGCPPVARRGGRPGRPVALLRGPLVRRVRPIAGGGGRTGGGAPVIGHRILPAGGAVAVTLRPVPTQRIATATFGEDAWTVKPLYGPGLLAMIVAPPGVGKTEIAYGSLAAAVDGLPFCGLETRQAPAGAAALRDGAQDDPAGPAALGLRRRARRARARGRRAAAPAALRCARTAVPGHLIDVVHASDAYAPDADGRRPQWADVIRATVPRSSSGGGTTCSSWTAWPAGWATTPPTPRCWTPWAPCAR